MKSVGVAATLASLCTAIATVAAPAQERPTAGVGLGLSGAWDESDAGGAVASRSGVVFEGAAALTLSFVELDLSYRQGTFSAADAGDERELVEGQAMLGLRFVRWLKLETGPRLRAYVTPAGTERWIFWDGRVHAAARLIPPNVWAYLHVGRALGGDLPGLEFDHAQGAEAGLVARLARAPVWGRLSYWVHRASGGDARRVETVQGLSFGVTAGIPRR